MKLIRKSLNWLDLEAPENLIWFTNVDTPSKRTPLTLYVNFDIYYHTGRKMELRCPQVGYD